MRNRISMMRRHLYKNRKPFRQNLPEFIFPSQALKVALATVGEVKGFMRSQHKVLMGRLSFSYNY